MLYGQGQGGGSIAAGRVGIGANFAKSRLMLAKRAGYLPQGMTMNNPDEAPEQWKLASSNLARDARQAGFPNPMQFLRQGATQGGKLPARTAMRPGAQADPAGSLAYANSRIAQMIGRAPGGAQPPPSMMLNAPRLPRLPNLPQVGMPNRTPQLPPHIMQLLMARGGGGMQRPM
jgi:hypothetical protein